MDEPSPCSVIELAVGILPHVKETLTSVICSWEKKESNLFAQNLIDIFRSISGGEKSALLKKWASELKFEFIEEDSIDATLRANEIPIEAKNKEVELDNTTRTVRGKICKYVEKQNYKDFVRLDNIAISSSVEMRRRQMIQCLKQTKTNEDREEILIQFADIIQSNLILLLGAVCSAVIKNYELVDPSILIELVKEIDEIDLSEENQNGLESTCNQLQSILEISPNSLPTIHLKPSDIIVTSIDI